MYLYHVGIS